jgi:hypothetical protein
VIAPVFADSLRKTGIFADRAGDFSRFPAQDLQTEGLETKSNARIARISGSFSRLLGSRAEGRNAWLRREDSNLDMVNSKSDVLAWPRETAEPLPADVYK